MRTNDTFLIAIIGGVLGYFYGNVEGALIGFLVGFVASRIILEKQGLRGLLR